MNIVFDNWVKELDEELEITRSPEINIEATSNMMAYGVPKEAVETQGSSNLSRFIASCQNIYHSKSNGYPMVFYSWFDEQAGQLRMSAVSEEHNKLPFNCKLKKCSLEALSEAVISQNSGLFMQGEYLKVWEASI